MWEVFYNIESSRFREGVFLEEYRENVYIVAGGTGQSGMKYKKWAYPQSGDQSVSEKAVPVAVKLGLRHEAIETLNKMIDELKGNN